MSIQNGAIDVKKGREIPELICSKRAASVFVGTTSMKANSVLGSGAVSGSEASVADLSWGTMLWQERRPLRT